MVVMCRSLVACLLVGLFFVGCGDNDEEKQTICPVTEKCGDAQHSYKELSQKWWQWMIGIGFTKSPAADADGTNCAESQPSDVWFLAGAGVPDKIERTCTVPSGRGMFFPIISMLSAACKQDEDCQARGFSTTECAGDPDTDEYLAECLKDYPDNIESLAASVDGTAVENLRDFRVESGKFEVTGVDDDDDRMWPCSKGTRNAMADGYYLYVEPLSAGEHTIAFSGKDKGGYSLDVEYTLTVE